MKTKHFGFIAVSLAILIFVTSCSDKPTVVTVKPIATSIEGELGDYLEIVDTSYFLQKHQKDNKYEIEIKIKSKVATDDRFDTRLSTNLILLNNSDEVLSGFEEFKFDDYKEAEKFFSIISEGGIISVKFSGDVIDGGEIDKNGVPQSDFIKGFYIKSDVYNATVRTRKHWQSKVDEFCNVVDEIFQILEGKKKVDGRYGDNLLDKSIDIEGEIKYDLSKLTEKQKEQFEKCLKRLNSYYR